MEALRLFQRDQPLQVGELLAAEGILGEPLVDDDGDGAAFFDVGFLLRWDGGLPPLLDHHQGDVHPPGHRLQDGAAPAVGSDAAGGRAHHDRLVPVGLLNDRLRHVANDGDRTGEPLQTSQGRGEGGEQFLLGVPRPAVGDVEKGDLGVGDLRQGLGHAEG